jgi:FAD/FMN-containing dehydrogenase
MKWFELNKEEILRKLEKIVGKDYASNKLEDLYIYSRDPGASKPRSVDFVVLPNTTEQVQQIIKLANEEKIPIVPMGGGLTLSGLVIPVKGGIVMDMKRMDRIIEINKMSRYALIEAGVTSGQLMAYLNENHPDLEPPIPDAPPSVTIAGNALIHGSGYLSQKFGDHGSMINGLEVVLPNGEICKLGSSAISDSWFTRGPLPDFIGLFISSFGTMGIVTKLSIKLFPKPKLRDLVLGLCSDPKVIPEILHNITYTDVAEDILIGIQDKPEWMKGYVFLIVYITGDTPEELESKTSILRKLYKKGGARFMKAPDRIRDVFLEKPQFAAKAADFRKGGGFEYVGSFIPLEKIPNLIDIGTRISIDHGIVPTMGARLIGKGHSAMFFISYSFNRADEKDLENARDALHQTDEAVLALGGIPWKAELAGQKLILEKLDSNYKKLLNIIRNALDPNGIMNPGNWEVKKN